MRTILREKLTGVGQNAVAMMNVMREHLALGAMTVTGKTVGENIEGAEVYDADVIRPLDKAIYAKGALAALKGSLAPNGCVIKPSAQVRAVGLGTARPKKARLSGLLLTNECSQRDAGTAGALTAGGLAALANGAAGAGP